MPTRFPPGPFLRSRHSRPFTLFLPGLLLAACGGTPMPGDKIPPPDTIIQSDNAPSPVAWEFAHWRRDGDNYIWIPGRHVAHTASSN